MYVIIVIVFTPFWLLHFSPQKVRETEKKSEKRIQIHSEKSRGPKPREREIYMAKKPNKNKYEHMLIATARYGYECMHEVDVLEI